MARLSIRLLGSFQVALGSEPIETFKSDKVRALLAYLAVESERPHRRERLAGLLWPEFPQRSARVNLRDALANLRKVIGDREATPPFLHISRQALQFNSASDAWVDVWVFTRRARSGVTGQQLIDQLEEAVELYRGSFLEGLSLADSPIFDEWALLERESLHRQVTDALRQLATYYEQRGEYGVALGYARRLLELDPLLEAVHRQAMRLLVYGGERGVALTQYAACRRVLAAELDVTPSPDTERLYEQIRSGELEIAVSPSAPAREFPIQRPSFLAREVAVQVERPVFVARERELDQLERYLEHAVAGRGQVAFVIGGPGRGKTMLMEAFARRATAAYPDLLVASGNGNAYSGVGDPYLPFRDALEMLAGDVEARWTAGAIDRDHALRLWHALPVTAQALVELGPDLIDTFVPGRALLSRAVAYQGARASDAAWRTRLEELITRKTSLPPDPNLQQSALFKQYTRVLAALAQQRPLLLVLDDLQWLDMGSIGLLFHLGRELSRCRILVLGAYRPEEIALGYTALPEGRSSAARPERHPLEGVLAEFKRRYGDVWLDLGQTAASENRQFVDDLLDSAPNRLDKEFRSALLRRTEGHPLFAAELLRAMQERGDLIQDKGGCWVRGPRLDWKTLPPRVEGVIAERVNRLEKELRQILAVASVEGEQFTAQVIARVQGADERGIMRLLRGPLEEQHRLVNAQGVRYLDGLHLSLHRFRHNLFQKYVYDGLNAVERACLHADVGHALEALYADHPEELATVTPQLARHFQEAGITAKAIEYLRQAGERGTRLSASAEAIAHFTQALRLLKTLQDSPQRAQTELSLQLALAVPLLISGGWATPEMTQVVARARELCEQVGETPQLFGALWFTYTYHCVRGENEATLQVAQRLLILAERFENPGLVLLAHYALAFILLQTGEFAAAVARAEHSIALYDPGQHHALTFRIVGHNPKAQCLETAGMALWALGYPDQARGRAREALVLAEELAHPYTLALAYQIAGIIQAYCRDWRSARERSEVALEISNEHGLAVTRALAAHIRGLALAKQGHAEEGIEDVHRGKGDLQAIGSRVAWAFYLACLAEAYIAAGRAEEAFNTLVEAQEWIAKTQEGYWEAEIHRLKGELLQQQGHEAEAEASFGRAIEAARGQSAKSLELRATMSLARLWQTQNKREQAREVLGEIYGWFSEGFDTLDLLEAKAMLGQLCGA